MKSPLVIIASVLLLGPAIGLPQTGPILGAKVYRPVRAPAELVQFAKSLGVNTLFVGDELAHSQLFREACRTAGLKYFLIIRTFNDPEAAQQDPTLVSIDREGRPARRGDDVMICPSRADFRRQKLRRIRAAIERIQPDGVTLDYFRYFIYWEAVDPLKGPGDFPAFCFDGRCVRDFLNATKVQLRTGLPYDPTAVPRELIEDIWREHREAWYDWRAKRIADDAADFTGFIRKQFPGLPIVLHAVPWTRDEFDGAREKIVGQDLRLLASSFDYVSPMAYSALTHRGPGWVERLDRELLQEVPAGKLLPSIEVGPDGPEFPPMSAAHYESDLNAALASKTGVVLYHLELLLNDSDKQAITQRVLSDLRKGPGKSSAVR